MRDSNKVYRFRALMLKPIFDAVDDKCINRTKLAHKLGISKTMLYLYQTGQLQVPPGFIDGMIAEINRQAIDPNAITPEVKELVERKAQTKGA
jgi:DNA-binding transcriptional regulator YdaS (Cro superfamily)